MMTYSRGRSALRIGLVTLIGAVSFGVLFVYSTNRVLGAERSTLFIRLTAADGLQRGDAVLHRGVNVGQVKAIDFAGADVVIRVRLMQAVPVSRGARAAMVAADVFGRQSIVITDARPGGAPLADGDTVAGTGPRSMAARFEHLGDQVGHLLSEPMIDKVRTTLHGAGSAAANAADAALQIGSLARSAETMIGEQRHALSNLTREAGLLAQNVREAANPETLAALRADLRLSAANLSSATASMDTAAASLVRILGGLESGQGSAGRLLTDSALYDRAAGSLAALEHLLADIRQNPKRYVTIKVF